MSSQGKNEEGKKTNRKHTNTDVYLSHPSCLPSPLWSVLRNCSKFGHIFTQKDKESNSDEKKWMTKRADFAYYCFAPCAFISGAIFPSYALDFLHSTGIFHNKAGDGEVVGYLLLMFASPITGLISFGVSHKKFDFHEPYKLYNLKDTTIRCFQTNVVMTLVCKLLIFG